MARRNIDVAAFRLPGARRQSRFQRASQVVEAGRRQSVSSTTAPAATKRSPAMRRVVGDEGKMAEGKMAEGKERSRLEAHREENGDEDEDEDEFAPVDRVRGLSIADRARARAGSALLMQGMSGSVTSRPSTAEPGGRSRSGSSLSQLTTQRARAGSRSIVDRLARKFPVVGEMRDVVEGNFEGVRPASASAFGGTRARRSASRLSVSSTSKTGATPGYMKPKKHQQYHKSDYPHHHDDRGGKGMSHSGKTTMEDVYARNSGWQSVVTENDIGAHTMNHTGRGGGKNFNHSGRSVMDADDASARNKGWTQVVSENDIGAHTMNHTGRGGGKNFNHSGRSVMDDASARNKGWTKVVGENDIGAHTMNHTGRGGGRNMDTSSYNKK